MSINAQLYTRGYRWDYDNWAAHGCTCWSCEEVLPYFIRADDNSRHADAYHGQGGPLRVSDVIPHELTTVFARAAQQAGMPFNPDFNGAEQAGLGLCQVMNRNGRRSSASVCYLKPVANNVRLALRCNAHVERIEITKGRAAAVWVDGQRIETAREVLLTAGAIGIPRLLMHSGIGPKQQMTEIGIDPVMDVPAVGENLHDNMDVFVVTECVGLQNMALGTGIVAWNICDGGGFWYACQTDDTPAPDIQFHFLPGSGLEQGLRPISNGMTLNSAYLRPHSRGRVRLISKDPRAKVLIDPSYRGDPHDVAMSVEGSKLARRIVAQPAFKDWIKAEAHPGAAAVTDDDIKRYAYRHARSDYHPVASYRMGAEEDPEAMVDPQLMLTGLEVVRPT